MTDWKHNALQADLATYLRESKGVMAWEDMQLGPAGSPRPDVYTVPPSFAKFRPMVYEIKISKSDFRSDVTTGKWQRYLEFACGVIFAAPRGLIGKDDLPAGCGLIQRGETGWRTVKAPTLQHVDTLPRDAWIKLLLDGVQREASRRAHDRGADTWGANKAIQQRHGEDVARLVGRAQRARSELERAIQRDEEKRKEIVEQTDRWVQMHRDRAQFAKQELSQEQRSLATELGCDADIESLTSAIRGARKRLSEDAEISRLRQCFQRAQTALNGGLEPLPGEQQKEAAE